MRRGIRTRILVLWMLLVLAVSVALFIAIRSRVERQNLETLRGDLLRQARALSVLLDPSDPELDRRVDAAAAGQPFRITVISPQGRVLADSAFSGERLARMENHGARPEILQAARQGVGARFRYSTSVETWLFYLARRLPGGRGYLRLALPWQRQWDAVGLAGVLGLGALALLLGGAGLAWLSARRWDRSAALLGPALEQLSRLEEPVTVPLASHDELGGVARLLEAAAWRVREQVDLLRADHGYLEALTENLEDGVLIVDGAARVMVCNRALLEICGEDVGGWCRGCASVEIVRSSEVEEGLDRVLREGTSLRIEIQMGSRQIRVHLGPVREAGEVRGAVAVFRDVTTLYKLERVRRQFVANVSHELRTPLTSIRGYAETLAAEPDLEEPHRGFVRKIGDNARRLSDMIEGLLELSRLESGELRLELEEIHLGELVEELERELAPRAGGEFRIEVENRMGGDSFRAARAPIRQVFSNLLDNAWRHGHAHQVRIGAERGSEGLVFSVSDKGEGIPPGDLERIFERFFRVERDRARASGGYGIGLALVKHIIELHGGRVWAENEEGGGARVCFTLPEG